eukprot:TRINITY_DN14411_c0_g1_i2.p1 TRINITY_DN14411_c0_g1~~TRINITY_DN14411_c0_g1_i2.p1  ORF type:complete len:141 (-),score=42.32 TRINITY_DN14411_c0_g1_i2:72-494(-)
MLAFQHQTVQELQGQIEQAAELSQQRAESPTHLRQPGFILERFKRPGPERSVLKHSVLQWRLNAANRQSEFEQARGLWARASKALKVQGWSDCQLAVHHGRLVLFHKTVSMYCLLYTSDAADEEDSVDLGGRRIIKKKKK